MTGTIQIGESLSVLGRTGGGRNLSVLGRITFTLRAKGPSKKILPPRTDPGTVGLVSR